MLTLADLQGDAASLWERVTYTAQTSQLFWLALGIAVVTLTPNAVYAKLFTLGKAAWIKHVVKPTPIPTPVVVTPVVPGIVPVVGEIKTAQDVSNLYHQFRAQKAARIAELEAQLAKEKQELIDLDKMVTTVVPTPSPVIGVVSP